MRAARPLAPLLLLLVAGAFAAPGVAQAADSRAFDFDHLQLAITSPEFLGVEGAGPLAKWGVQASATWRYSTGSLLADVPGGPQRTLVGTRSLLDVSMGATLWRRLGVAVALPVLLSQTGDMVDSRGGAVGDLRVALRANAFSVRGFGGAVLLAARLPTGDTSRFLGEGGPVIEPRLAAEWSGGALRAGLNLGARLRQSRSVADLTIGNEVFAAAALGVRPVRWLDVFGEIHADTSLSGKAFTTASTPVELLGGLGGRVRGFALTAAVGFGVVDGFGSPRVRTLLGLSYAYQTPPPPPPPGKTPPRPEPPPAEPPPPPPPPPVEEAAEEDEEEDPVEPPRPDEKNVTVSRDFAVLADPVFFGKDSARIRSRFQPELMELSRAVNARPWIKVLWIEGHTDDTGPREWNKQLSEMRARRVASFLVEHGVAQERVRTLALGETKPWFSNRQKSGREKNRRVTFLVERNDSKHPGPTPAPEDDGAPAIGDGAVGSGPPEPPASEPGPAAAAPSTPSHAPPAPAPATPKATP